ncbi:PIN-like domain-containing protein [Streptococcus pseudopneumoniae]|uniref:PIN-like domain-containing protein n=1 Tax=Streptococcus pseudopneumoniae TaxID=257758 RepID=UPI00066B9691|nr:PIN-like domain-containing protein [Streptococcus pseudopneumoniae]
MNYKDEFYGFYREPFNKENMTTENTIIVFDTNSLLNVFRFTPEASKEYFDIIQSIQDKIYIPYLVALEFHFHKSETLLLNEINVTKFKNNFSKNWNKLKSEAAKTLFSSLSYRNDTDNKELNAYLSDLLNSEDLNIENKLVEKISSISENQTNIFNALVEIMYSKTGERYTQDMITEIEKEGEERYKNGIPPGFNDANKKLSRSYNGIKYQQKFGDLIIWKDIISKAKEDRIKHVIFVTSDGKRDSKTDLNYKVCVGNDGNGKEKYQIIGPRIELIEEMKKETGADFYLMDELEFMKQFSQEEVSSQVAKSISDTLLDFAKILSTSINDSKVKPLVKSPSQSVSSKSSVVKRRKVTDVSELLKIVENDYEISDVIEEYLKSELPNMNFENSYGSIGWGEFEYVTITEVRIEEYTIEDDFYKIKCTVNIDVNIDFGIVTKSPFYEEPGDAEFEYESSELDATFEISFIYDLDYDTFDDIEINDFNI